MPVAPAPVSTEPIPLRTSSRDYSKPFGSWLSNPLGVYMPTSIPKASFNNSVRLTDLVKDGKIYLSLSDAIALAIENNYDIAIARYDLDIADTDILRTRSGATAVGRALRAGDRNAWRFNIDAVAREAARAGRRWAGGAGSGVNGLNADDGGSRAVAGESGSIGYGNHPAGAEPVSGNQLFQPSGLYQHGRI